MRPSCLDCTRKHLAKAYLQLSSLPVEWTPPLPEDHIKAFWLAIANLDEAEEETVLEFTGITDTIRETIRLPLMQYNKGEGNAIDPITARDHILKLITAIENHEPVTMDKAKHTPMMKDPAMDLARVSILLKESVTGYPSHRALAVSLLKDVAKACEGLNKFAVDRVIDKVMTCEYVETFTLVSRFLS